MLRSLTTLEEIDFLPEQYRQRSVQRRGYAGRVVFAGVAVGCLVVLCIIQRGNQLALKGRLEEVNRQHVLASAELVKLAEVQQKLQAANGHAGLLTFLRHPWPRTQVMAAILEPLPEEITLSEWRIASEAMRNAAPSPASSEVRQPVAEKKSGRELDLQRLVGEHGQRQFVVILVGQATHASALHEYLARLESSPLFSKIDLRSIEDQASDKRQNQNASGLHFTARAILRPAHGQLLGPGTSAQLANTPGFAPTSRGAER